MKINWMRDAAICITLALVLLGVGQGEQPYRIVFEKYASDGGLQGPIFPIKAGESIDLAVVVKNVTDWPVAGSSLILSYDPNVISSVSCIKSAYKEFNKCEPAGDGRYLFEGYDTFAKYTGDVAVAVLRLTANASAPNGSSTILKISGPGPGIASGTPVWGPFWQEIDTLSEDATLQVQSGGQGRTWTVCQSGCDFAAIQEAIDNASSGDTILVKSGEYPEHLNVNKTLTIRGQDRDSTIVNGTYSGDVINITADGVVIQNLTAKAGYRYHGSDYNITPFGIGVIMADDVTISGCRVTDCQYGIFADSVSGLTLDKNEADGNDVFGIRIDETGQSNITSNMVHDNEMGFISAFTKEGIRFIGNDLIHNEMTGLAFIDGLPGAIIENNRIENNSYLHFTDAGDYNEAGGYFEWVDGCVIRNNRFIHNGGLGLALEEMKDSVVEGNVMAANYAGFVYADMNLEPNNTISLSNTVDGKPILYLDGAKDRNLVGSQYACIYCIGCQNITIHDSVMNTRNGLGIVFRGGRELIIRNNSVSNNVFQNILVVAVADSTISGNIVDGSMYGSGVFASDNVTVSDNKATGNVHGLAAAANCNDVLFSHNILENNSVGFSFEYIPAPDDGYSVNCSDNVVKGGQAKIRDLGILSFQSAKVNVAATSIQGLYEGVDIVAGERNNLTALSINDCEFGIEIGGYGGTGKAIPSIYHRIIQNNVTVERNAFFTDQDEEYVYGNHVFLNNFISAEKPDPEAGSENGSRWLSMSGLPTTWGLPRSATFALPIRDSAGDSDENVFHTDTPVKYEYKNRCFEGYLGNYWNWYNGTDRCGNGVGRTPYKIMTNSTDTYPLISPTSKYIIDQGYACSNQKIARCPLN